MSSTKGKEVIKKKAEENTKSQEKLIDLTSIKNNPAIMDLVDISDPKNQEIVSHVEESLKDFEYKAVSKVIEKEFGNVSFKNNKNLLAKILHNAQTLD